MIDLWLDPGLINRLLGPSFGPSSFVSVVAGGIPDVH